MGSSNSTQQQPMKDQVFENPAFEQPWRPVDWSNREQMLQNLKEIRTCSGVDTLRILVVGPVGSGKSSFITSVNTALQGRNTYLAHSLAGGSSATLKYTVYKMKKGTDGSFFPFVFGDTMGLENDGGPHTDEIIDILRGHLQDGYRFNSSVKVTAESNDFNKNPSLNDKVHCLVFVIPFDQICLMQHEITNKLHHILRRSRDLGIPQVVIMSMVDCVCPLAGEGLKMIYMSKKVKYRMRIASDMLGVPMNYIFPVKNYHEEINPNSDVDILILTALTNIVHFCNDFVSRNV